MPEESQNLQVPQVSNPSVLDKPVPNPLAKNPNVHTHKVFAAVGLILIGTIIAAAGIWWYVDNQPGAKDDQVSTTNTSTKAKTATSSAQTDASSSKKDETADWKTYTNTKYMYLIKYPTDLSVSTGVEGLPGNEELRKIDTTAVVNVGKSAGETDLQITVIKETKTLDQVKQELLSDSNAKVSDMSSTQVANIAAIKYTYNGYPYITAVKNGYRYDFYLKSSETANKIFDTFKFL